MTNKQKYRIHCEKEDSIPIFSKDWWLDATAGEDSWDVVIIENGNNEIIASLPYVVKKNRLGFTVITQPQLTQHLGPWLKFSSDKYATILSQEKDLIQELFSKLPKHDKYQQNWYLERTNWLPLYWKGYSQTTRYTYRIEDLTDLDKIWKTLESSAKSHIKNAEQKYKLTIKDIPSIDEFIDLNKLVFKRQGMQLPYSTDLIKSIDNATKKKNSSKLFVACDDQGTNHAALYLVWDKNSSYCLMSGSVPHLRKSGAISLCRWKAIEYSSKVTKAFDFEGSMIEGVERFFRGFGAIQTPYFAISKTNSKVLKAIEGLKSIIRK